jgi:hypothetical protein
MGHDVRTPGGGAWLRVFLTEFSSVATAPKKPATEQAAALYAEESALGKIKSQLAVFRVK